jgi:type I restriction enzyme, S subunit
MKDSGVEWLGEIPTHWEVMRLKFAAKPASGHTPNRTIAEYWHNCTIPWVTLNDVSYLKDHDYIFETTNYINNLGLANSSARLLPTDTVILSRDATVGRCGILGRPMATSQHFVNWICHEKLLPKYLLHVFRGPMQQEFERLTMGATIRTIGMPDVNGLRVPIPPISEQ